MINSKLLKVITFKTNIHIHTRYKRGDSYESENYTRFHKIREQCRVESLGRIIKVMIIIIIINGLKF